MMVLHRDACWGGDARAYCSKVHRAIWMAYCVATSREQAFSTSAVGIVLRESQKPERLVSVTIMSDCGNDIGLTR